MQLFAGSVQTEEGSVRVSVSLTPEGVKLSAGRETIGEWSAEDCTISHDGDGTFHIEAEDDVLAFDPDDDRGFISALAEHPSGRRLEHRGDAARAIGEGPPPRPLTRAAFIALAFFTAFLGVWSLVRLIFG